jgi:ATP-dependent 26S proteasome regulatory subunit
MTSSQDTVQALRQALQFSPDNIPLRQHLAETLLSLGQAEAAEQEFRHALTLAPDHQDISFGLARAFYQQGKHSQAIVLLEDLIRQPQPPARAFILQARLLLNNGSVQQAVQHYHRGIELDPSVKDVELASRLGINATAVDSEVVEGKVRLGEGAVADQPSSVERPQITFQDVGGMETLKEEIRLKIIYPIQHAEMYKAYGKAIGGGILLYGPPGCGKTHLARATAGEIEAGFIAVGINDVLDMWMGQSERNLHELFDQARQNQPCVLFFDEVDALAASRSDLRHSAARQLINQFLLELDGVQHSNEGVLILAATNAPWHLDGAFRRPGRFDRILFVPPPDAAARAAILRLLCQGKPIQDIDFDYISQKTDKFSGADLKAVVDRAVEQKLQDAMKTGIPKPLTTSDLIANANTLKPSTREWFASARNYALYANQGGLYDDILKYLQS